jgi:hypothetical protein
MAQFITAKLSPYFKHQAMKTYWKRGQLYAFLTSVVCGKWPVSRSDHFIPEKVSPKLVIENKKLDLEKFPPILPSYPSLQASCLSLSHDIPTERKAASAEGSVRM